jgi:hypothetical protein
MGVEIAGDELIAQIKQARRQIEQRDAQVGRRITEIEDSVNELSKRANRPGADGGYSIAELDERKDVAEWLCTKPALATPKDDGTSASYEPSHAEISDALLARKVLRKLWRHGETGRLDPEERKSLTSVSFGQNAFVRGASRPEGEGPATPHLGRLVGAIAMPAAAPRRGAARLAGRQDI